MDCANCAKGCVEYNIYVLRAIRALYDSNLFLCASAIACNNVKLRANYAATVHDYTKQLKSLHAITYIYILAYIPI